MKLNTKTLIDYKAIADQAISEGITKHAVCGVIFRGDDVLLIRRALGDKFRGGFWEVPGGKVEIGENFKQALVREIKEETNLTALDVQNYVGHVDYKVAESTVRLYMFVVKADDSKIKLQEREHQEYKWVPKDAAIKYLAKEEFTDLFLAYIKTLK